MHPLQKIQNKQLQFNRDRSLSCSYFTYLEVSVASVLAEEERVGKQEPSFRSAPGKCRFKWKHKFIVVAGNTEIECAVFTLVLTVPGYHTVINEVLFLARCDFLERRPDVQLHLPSCVRDSKMSSAKILSIQFRRLSNVNKFVRKA